MEEETKTNIVYHNSTWVSNSKKPKTKRKKFHMKHCINATTSNELITTSNTTVQFSFDEKPANIKLLEQLI